MLRLVRFQGGKVVSNVGYPVMTSRLSVLPEYESALS
jgi:hypothetical protein